jgi:hypothetical protein
MPHVITSSALGGPGKAPASERIVMGAIGIGSMGTGDLRGFLGFAEVQMVAVCDVVKEHRERAKGLVDARNRNGDCKSTDDFREIVTRDDIDAVMIATPDHWHAIPSIWACRHRKDVYCQKPLSLTIREGRAMADAVRRYDRVFSCGSQRVRGDYGGLADYVDSGAIGQVREIYVGIGGPSRPCDLGGEGAVPPGMNWDLWLGPAPWAPYHPFRCSSAHELGGRGWRTWQDYSGGMMTDWGGHKFGGAMYAARLEDTGPAEIIPPDGKAVTLLTYVFANGVRIYRGGRDLEFKGTLGDAPAPKGASRGREAAQRGSLRQYRGQGGIHGDFIECVKTRRRCFQDVEYAHRTATVCHLGNIAYQLKRPLKWDPVKEEFPGDAEANLLLDRPRREPWTL